MRHRKRNLLPHTDAGAVDFFIYIILLFWELYMFCFRPLVCFNSRRWWRSYAELLASCQSVYSIVNAGVYCLSVRFFFARGRSEIFNATCMMAPGDWRPFASRVRAPSDTQMVCGIRCFSSIAWRLIIIIQQANGCCATHK